MEDPETPTTTDAAPDPSPADSAPATDAPPAAPDTAPHVDERFETAAAPRAAARERLTSAELAEHADDIRAMLGDEFEKFVRAHAGVPLRVVVEPRTNILRLSNLDQTEVLVGAVHGNVFQPQR